MSAGFRPDDILKNKVGELWENAISPHMRMAYKTGFQCLLTFLTMSGMHFSLPELPVLTEDILIYFVTHCHSHLKLHWVTIKLYLSLFTSWSGESFSYSGQVTNIYSEV